MADNGSMVYTLKEEGIRVSPYLEEEDALGMSVSVTSGAAASLCLSGPCNLEPTFFCNGRRLNFPNLNPHPASPALGLRPCSPAFHLGIVEPHCFLGRSILKLKIKSTPIRLNKAQAMVDDEDGEEEDLESDVEDDSMVLLIQLARNFLKRISSKAIKAARSMLPPVFSIELITFSVNGALLLGILSTAKAFLEVICSLGTMIFLSLLVIRSAWSLMSYTRLEGQDKNSKSTTMNPTGDSFQTSGVVIP